MAWRAYQRLLRARPWTANLATSAAVMFTADTIAQYLQARKSDESDESDGENHLSQPFGPDGFNICRSVVMVSWNTFIFSPFFLTWYRVMDRFFKPSLTGSLAKTVVTALSVTVPINAGAITFSTVAEACLRSVVPVTPAHSVEAQTVPQQDGELDPHRKVIVPLNTDNVLQDLKVRWALDLTQVFKSSVMFWGPLNFINFAFVPPHLRLLLTVCGSVAWSTYLSLMAHKEHDSEAVASALQESDVTATR